jgi:hypothetical protein
MINLGTLPHLHLTNPPASSLVLVVPLFLSPGEKNGTLASTMGIDANEQLANAPET